MVDSIGSAPRDGLQIWFGRGKWCREDDGIDVLWRGLANRTDERKLRKTYAALKNT